jgi:hypothetical protein
VFPPVVLTEPSLLICFGLEVLVFLMEPVQVVLEVVAMVEMEFHQLECLVDLL